MYYFFNKSELPNSNNKVIDVTENESKEESQEESKEEEEEEEVEKRSNNKVREVMLIMRRKVIVTIIVLYIKLKNLEVSLVKILIIKVKTAMKKLLRKQKYIIKLFIGQ